MIPPLCRVICHYDRLAHNLGLLGASGKPMMPVIKADAYGHGLLESARALMEAGADSFAVGNVAEGVALRRIGFGGRIVALLGAVSDDDLNAVASYGITPLLHDRQGLDRLASVSRGANLPLPVAVKCDSGMGRLGFVPDDMPMVADLLRKTIGLRPEMLVSHLAVADEPGQDAYTFEQARRFNEAARALRTVFPDVLLSLANSACLLAFPELAGDVARPGLALYGGNPLYGTSREVLGAGLEPVMEARVPVLSVHTLRAGESLGYGRTYVASTDRKVAWVGIGYADGFRRNPAPGACMTLFGHRAPLVGRVAMQMSCLDITDLPAGVTVRPGDEAAVLGGEGDAVTPQELAQWWGTIPYEVTCLLGRNRRA